MSRLGFNNAPPQSRLLILLLLSAVAAVACGGTVLELDETSIAAAVATHPLLLVQVEMTWGSSEAFLMFREEMAERTLPVQLAVIKYTEQLRAAYPDWEVHTGSDFDIKLFRGDVRKPQKYVEPMTPQDMLAFISRALLPEVRQLSSQEEQDEFLSNHLAIVGYFPPGPASVQSQLAFFNHAAKLLRDQFAFALLHDITPFKSAAAAPQIWMVKQYDERMLRYTGPHYLDDFQAWARRHKLPYLPPYVNWLRVPGYVDSRPLLLLHLDPAADNTQAMAEVAKVSAAARRSNAALQFGWVDYTKGWDGVRSGLSGTKYPGITINNVMSKERYYPFSEDLSITAENVDRFANDFVSGRLSAYRHSEPLPDTNDGKIKKMVLKNYESLVLDVTKDVVVLFKNEYCGHCTHFLPIYEQVVARFAADHDLIFAIADNIENDFPSSLDITGVPDVRIFTKKQKRTPIRFEWARTVDEVERWVRLHALSLQKQPPAPTRRVKTEL